MAQLAASPLHIHRRPRWRAPIPTAFAVPPQQATSSRDGKMPCPDRRHGTSKRFALETRAVSVMNRFYKKLVNAVKSVLCVEAFKHGEEPVEFGPDAPLMAMCYWDLRIVQEAPFEPIRVGDKIPDDGLSYLDDHGQLQCLGIHDLVRRRGWCLLVYLERSHIPAGVERTYHLEFSQRTSTDLHALSPACIWHFAKPLEMTMLNTRIVSC